MNVKKCKKKPKVKRITIVKTLDDLAQVERGDPIKVHAIEIAFDSGYGHRISQGILLEKNLEKRNFSYYRSGEYDTNRILCAPVEDTDNKGESIRSDYRTYWQHDDAQKLIKKFDKYVAKGGLHNYKIWDLKGEKLEKIKKTLGIC